jgi:putative ABC transport system permease protein
LLTENILLGLIGGAGGLLFAVADMHINEIAMPERVARFMAGWSNISLNGRALAFSLLLAVLAGVVSGFAPALEGLRINLVDQLKSGSRARGGLRPQPQTQEHSGRGADCAGRGAGDWRGPHVQRA